MINANTIIRELQNINYQFLENNKNGFKVDNKNYIFKIGKIPILLSAHHAVKQCRESQVKPSDYLTGALAIYLAKKCDYSYVVKFYNDNDDPNFPLGTTILEIENYYLLKSFIYSMKKSIYETYDYSMKLEKVRRNRI